MEPCHPFAAITQRSSIHSLLTKLAETRVYAENATLYNCLVSTRNAAHFRCSFALSQQGNKLF